MRAFTVHTGRAVPLRRSDVDTDQIIPSDWLKRVERTGFGAGLFSDWRRDPEFVLNNPSYEGASILVAAHNFGTGSSREHAVWALEDYGFRAVLAAGFADIFRNNCTKVGVLPVVLPLEVIERLWSATEADPATELTVDLEARAVRCAAADVDEPFVLDDFTRQRLLEGLDDIALTLRHDDDIAAYERSRPAWLPVALRFVTDPPAELPDAELFADLSRRLRTAHQRVAVLDAAPEVKGAVTRRLIAVTNAAKHDLHRASTRLDALLADLDADRLPPPDLPDAADTGDIAE